MVLMVIPAKLSYSYLLITLQTPCSLILQAIELEDGNPKNNIMEAIFPFPHLLAKVGDKYKACVMVLKDFDYVCYIGRYSPTEGSQTINLLLNSYKPR